MKVELEKREVISILIASIAVALSIAFDDKQPAFNLAHWLENYFTTFLLTLLAFVIFTAASKFAAARMNCALKTSLWNIKRVSFAAGAHSKSPFYMGVIIPLMLAILSDGKVSFGAGTQHSLETRSAHRLGRRFVEITEYERAKIAACGPMILTALALIVRLINVDLAVMLSNIMMIIAFTNMLPLPNLNGASMFFGSKLVFVFVASVISIVALLISTVSPVTLAIIALIVSLVNFLLFYNYFEIAKA